MISVSFAVTTHARHELNMALDQWRLIRANVSDSEHNQTYASAQLRSSICLTSLRRVLLSNVVFRFVCLIVCATLGPKTVISRGEQNRCGWRRLIKFYGGLQLMKSTVAHGGGQGLKPDNVVLMHEHNLMSLAQSLQEIGLSISTNRSATSLINRRDNVGPRTVLCGTPLMTGTLCDQQLFNLTV